MKKIAILQSNYIPWKGYFDIIAFVDEFILLEDVQYTTRDWRNRNKIKTPIGTEWLSVPVGPSTKRIIRDVMIEDSHWQRKHWASFEANYRRAKYFNEVSSWLAPLYLESQFTNLSHLNKTLIAEICKYIGINTIISNSGDYKLTEGKTERLVSLCQQACATDYISGPGAQSYIHHVQFEDAGIGLTWFNYAGYLEYPQLWGRFVHEVSILDLLFNCGRKSVDYMRYVQR